MPPVTRGESQTVMWKLCKSYTKSFHSTPYASGSSNVLTNGSQTVRIGDVTACGDPSVGGSGSVFVNGIPVHRQGDGTGGHGSWVPNASASGSPNVISGWIITKPDYATLLGQIAAETEPTSSNLHWKSAVFRFSRTAD